MITHNYNYADCLRSSVRSAWTLDDCFQDRTFDFAKPFMPDRLAGVSQISCLDDAEKLKLNQIRGNSYCHIFAFAEEYIIPMVMDLARKDVYGDETRLRYLLRFAEEETKHQEMLDRAMSLFTAGFGAQCEVIAGREEIAKVVLEKSDMASLLLTSQFEWFTQRHYLEHVHGSSELDELFRDLLKFHWIDESQHARADTLMIEELAETLTEDEANRAITEFIELLDLVDGLLLNQVEMDISSLENVTQRQFSGAQKDELRHYQNQAYRWTFSVSGLEHPNFIQSVENLTKAGPERLRWASERLMSGHPLH